MTGQVLTGQTGTVIILAVLLFTCERLVGADVYPNTKLYWNYFGVKGYQNWASAFPNCASIKRQSPINIDPTKAKFMKIPTFEFKNFNTKDNVAQKANNDGHSVIVLYESGDLQVSQGGLDGTYKVVKLHFHWGSHNTQGSEHKIGGTAYPMELQIVAYNMMYGNIGLAMKQGNGLAVLGFMMQISKEDNPTLEPLVSKLPDIQSPDKTVDLPTIALDFLLPKDRTDFYRYDGSLTTPTCDETVTWSIFKGTIPISHNQLKAFRRLASSQYDRKNNALPMVNNFRPVQPLGQRVVYITYCVECVSQRDTVVHHHTNQSWSYFGENGYQNWASVFPNCASNTRQSPIDIDLTKAEFVKIKPFEFKNFNTKDNVKQKAINDGHLLTVVYESGDLEVSQGGLNGTYKVAKLHFHWGSLNTQGSDHTIGLTAYPMELHIMAYNMVYADFGEAMTQGNGLAFLGFMMQITKKDNPALEALVSKLLDIQSPDQTVDLPTIALDSLLPKNRKEFFRYDGSLTTPTCDKTVTWTVFNSTIPISQNQLKVFRHLNSSEIDDNENPRPMVDNFRPVQPLGQRVVYSNFLISAAPSSSATAPAVASIAFTLGNLAWSFD